jgi:hypothetical protein
MARDTFSVSTVPVEPASDPLLLFIQQAQLILVYKETTRAAITSPGGAIPARPHTPGQREIRGGR